MYMYMYIVHCIFHIYMYMYIMSVVYLIQFLIEANRC